jgi:hypothetical protein
MLKHRLIFGPLMIVGLVLVFWLDNWLDQVNLGGTMIQSWTGRTYLPAGLLLLLLLLTLIVFAAGEMCEIFKRVGVEADRVVVTLSGVTGCLLMYGLPQRLTSRTTMAIFATLLVSMFIIALLEYSWKHARTEGAVAVAAVTMFAMIYMGLLPGFLLAIRRW